MSEFPGVFDETTLSELTRFSEVLQGSYYQVEATKQRILEWFRLYGKQNVEGKWVIEKEGSTFKVSCLDGPIVVQQPKYEARYVAVSESEADSFTATRLVLDVELGGRQRIIGYNDEGRVILEANHTVELVSIDQGTQANQVAQGN